MLRIINAVLRGLLVLVVIAAPSYLLPGATPTGQDLSLIIGGLAGLFTIWEYGTLRPGFVDFRFAPPYNRIRFFGFVVFLFAIVFLCRSNEGADAFAADFLAFADRMVELAAFPLSPAALAGQIVAMGEDEALALLISRATALSLVVAIGLVAVSMFFIWLMRWPVDRAGFNLWDNVPSMTPGGNKDIVYRLRRNGMINCIVAATLPFMLLVMVARSGGWFDPTALENYQSLLWGCVVWAYVPAALFIRGQAFMKLAWLIDRAREV
ncbi:MAG: hypothetical protein ACPGID_01745 [Rubricella sp.]